MVDDNYTQTVSRRDVLRTGTIASTAILAGCIGGGGDTLSYISRGGIPQESEREIMDEWSEESGVDVTHQEVSDDSEILELIAASPEEFDFTNLVPAAFSEHRLEYDGELFTEIDYGEIPNYDNIKDSWQDAPFLEGHDLGTFYYNNSQSITGWRATSGCVRSAKSRLTSSKAGVVVPKTSSRRVIPSITLSPKWVV